MMKIPARLVFAAALVVLAGCSQLDNRHVMHISVADQKMVVTDHGNAVATYPVSTSKYGLSAKPNSYGTPLGKHRVAKKLGDGLPLGAVLKSRRFTGEVLPVDAPGRDPIVTRILWLQGRESRNRNSYARLIYIHGTPEERNIGIPTSYGCIRMRSRDVVALFDRVGIGARVDIFREPLAHRFPHLVTAAAPEKTAVPAAVAAPTVMAGQLPAAPRGL